MKRLYPAFPLPFFLLLVLFGFRHCPAQTPTTCQLAYELIKTAEKYHYAPRPVDNAFSALVFDEFIHSLDPGGLILSSDDIGQLSDYRLKIDDELSSLRCEFLSKTTQLYESRLKSAKTLLEGLQKGSFDLSAKDSLVVLRKQNHVKPGDLGRRWIQLIKFQMLSSYLLQTDTGEKIQYPSGEKLATLRSEAIDRYQCRMTSRLNYPSGLEAYVGNKFLKALSAAFDPHTEYFGAPEKNEFETMLSSESKGYGFEFKDNELGEMEIYAIVPGSPAWNSNAINEGDVILSIEAADGQSKDFTCIGVEEAYQYINNEKLDEAYFHLQKQNGERIRVKLFKDKIDVEENVIKSFLLEGERKIGYIYLPSFYTQLNSVSYLPNGCANDLAKEIIKLKREGIEGLILDVRNNGGGSMLEAVRVAGIFINYGALGIVDFRNKDPETLKDLDRGTVFNQPLLVLINKFSASASELFAAAMQDYNRAVIVGSSSYGKSTAQQFLPLDAYQYPDLEHYKGKSNAFVKLTEGAFFRVTGDTHQKEGVQPDVRLPDIYDRPDIGESQLPTALDFPKIDKKTYYYPLSPLPLETLQKLSADRTQSDRAFQEIEKLAKSTTGSDVLYTIPLSFGAFENYFHTMLTDEAATTYEEKIVFSLKNPSYMQGISSMNNPKEEINAQAMQEIEHDLYIRESYLIMDDLIRLTNQ